MVSEERIRKIVGLQTVESVMDKLDLKRQSAINLLSELRKKEHVTTHGGGPQKRLYKITLRKQREREEGMFDIINKYSPMKLNPWFDHQVHGPYGPEDALVDAVQTESFRVILASMRLFNHVEDWKKLYNKAKEKRVWQKIGALYDVARKNFRVRKMPERYRKSEPEEWTKITRLHDRNNYPEVEDKWKVHIPFNQRDMEAVA